MGSEVPEGDYIYLLLENVYTLKQVARIWMECFRDSLAANTANGRYEFKQSAKDPCLFHKGVVILISQVDDYMIFAKKKDLVDQLIRDLNKKFTFTKEDNMLAYLGVKKKYDNESDTISLMQLFLIQRIVEALGSSFQKVNIKSSPLVSKEIQYKYKDGSYRK